MEDWDTEDFQPKGFDGQAAEADKWAGEDEDDTVKESWEDEEEEKKDVEKPAEVKPIKQKNPKKTLAKIAEKERLEQEEIERKIREKMEQEISPEERIRMQKESDLKLAMETTFGVGNAAPADGSIDSMNPKTKEEFTELSEAITKKLLLCNKSADYPSFIEDLVRNICVPLTSFDLKKLKTTIDNMCIEKQKLEKGEKAKKSKGKAKTKLRIEGDNAQLNDYGDYGGYEDYDDFM